jgi:hypothetical protein
MALIEYLLFFLVISGTYGQGDGICNDDLDSETSVDPDCLKEDKCADNFGKVQSNPDAFCHYTKLNDLNILENNCCGSDFENSQSFMFEDECEKHTKTFKKDICQRPIPNLYQKLAATRQKNIDECPDECTTKVKLLKEENEFSYNNGKFELKTTVWNKKNFEVLWKNSCQSYVCDYPTYSATEESWNVVASICLCLKEPVRQNLIATIDNGWKKCHGNSSLSRTVKPLECQVEVKEFDDSEYQIDSSLNQIKVSSYDSNENFLISRENETYCFGPSWTEDDDEIVKMKLFYCDPKAKPESSGIVPIIIGAILGTVAVIIAIIVGVYLKFR